MYGTTLFWSDGNEIGGMIMGKGIVLVDIPEKCEECFYHRKNLVVSTGELVEICDLKKRQYFLELDKKPEWCPIREIPSKKEPSKFPFMLGEPWKYTDYEKGWNDCLDYLEGIKCLKLNG